jgi:hypothetical protein
MRKLLVWIISVAIALSLVLLHSIPAFPQSPVAPEQSNLTINAATRSKVIDAAIKKLDDYVFPDVAQKVQANIRIRLQNGEYNDITSATKLAEMLTSHLQAISHDKHLKVLYSYEPFQTTDDQGEPTAPEEREKFHQSNAWQNFGVQKVERLEGNIGYLDFRFIGFPPLEDAGDTAIAAMNFLSNTNALIIDLRQSSGGHPGIVALISTYLFDNKPVHLNNLHWREKDASGTFRERIEQYWTLPYVPGKRYLNKDVYVLTSKNTFSASEEFAYNLKQLKRATIVGEATAGGANPGRLQTINDHFGIFVPTGRAVNPVTQTNWEGTGVQPDVTVAAELALKTAHLAVLQKILAKTTEQEFVDELKKAIETVQRESARLPQ